MKIMEMTLRWYGSKFDTVTLQQIRQIPGVTGVITTLYDTAPGEVWSRERIRAMKEEVEAAGLHIAGIESVNIHDAIKTGAPERDQYIANYIETLENLGKEDLHLVCYNFMPVFDWTRTELARVRPDGSTVLASPLPCSTSAPAALRRPDAGATRFSESQICPSRTLLLSFLLL